MKNPRSRNFQKSKLQNTQLITEVESKKDTKFEQKKNPEKATNYARACKIMEHIYLQIISTNTKYLTCNFRSVTLYLQQDQ